MAAYSDFTIGKVKKTFSITTIEGSTFLPVIPLIAPSPMFMAFLEENLPLAVALPSEKAKSELLISLQMGIPRPYRIGWSGMKSE
jgi:hypothetical protein